MTHYVLFINDDGEPELNGPHPNEELRDRTARLLMEQSADVEDFMRLDIDGDRPIVSSFDSCENFGKDDDQPNFEVIFP